MATIIYKIQNSKINYIITTQAFIDDYPTELDYEVNNDDEHHYFTIKFNSQDEMNKFTNELRKSVGLNPF